MANFMANVFAVMALVSALVFSSNVISGVLLIMVGLIIVSLISLVVILITSGRTCRA
jgi:urea transporter